MRSAGAAVRGAALWYCGTLHGKQQGRTAAWAGIQLLMALSVGDFDSAISTPGMHIASLGRVASSLAPVLDLSMTRSSPLSVLQLTSKQDGGRRANEVSMQPRRQLGPSACLMHDSVATALQQEAGKRAQRQLVTDGLGPENVGSRSCCIGLSTGSVSAAHGLADAGLEGSENGDRQAGRPPTSQS